jgi:hypothetical protein
MKMIRLWTLGSLEHKIYPTKETVDTLSELIEGLNSGSGCKDIIWGPDLTVTCIGEKDVDEDEMVDWIRIYKPGDKKNE